MTFLPFGIPQPEKDHTYERNEVVLPRGWKFSFVQMLLSYPFIAS